MVRSRKAGSFEQAGFLGLFALIGVACILQLSGCALFEDSPEPPDPNEFSAPQLAAEQQRDAAWYNTSLLRSMFGDFDGTESVYITDQESAAALIARGKTLVKGAAACGVCHAAKSGDDNAPLSGGRLMKDSFGKVHATNITPGKTGIKDWNVFELMRVIRSSIDRAGRPLSIDLHQSYRWLSDQDAKAISLYLLSQKPIENEVERRMLGGFERNRWGIIPRHTEVLGYVPAPIEEANLGYGRYLTNHVSACVQCHTPGGAKSGNSTFSGFYQSGGVSGIFDELSTLFDSAPLEEELADELLSSKQNPAAKPATSTAEINRIYDEAIIEGNFPVGGPNIRGTSDAGLKSWSEADIIRYLNSGTTPSGEVRENRFCPWHNFRQMSEVAKQAVAKYLKSL